MNPFIVNDQNRQIIETESRLAVTWGQEALWRNEM